MKKAALVLLVLALISPMAAASEIAGSFAQAKAEAASQGKPLLIDFFTVW